jgi:hypothetical protein
LVVTFVLFSVLAERRATPRAVTGTVAEFEAGKWLSLASHGSAMSFRIALREKTAFEGSRAAIKPGARVSVSYRIVGERRPVADKVRLLNNAEDR